MLPSLPLLSCELSMSVKGIPDIKKIKIKNKINLIYCGNLLNLGRFFWIPFLCRLSITMLKSGRIMLDT